MTLKEQKIKLIKNKLEQVYILEKPLQDKYDNREELNKFDLITLISYNDTINELTLELYDLMD